MRIPIQNIYYLLCYAWDRLEARGLVSTDALAGDRVEHLLAKVLDVGVGHLLRGGLDRGYVVAHEEGPRLRGKFLLSESISRCLLPQGQAACSVDALSHNVPHNRVIKAAMRTLLEVPGLDSTLRAKLRSHCQRMGSVADIDLSIANFRKVQLHRNLGGYRFMVEVANLVARSYLPDQRTGSKRFHPFIANEQEMGLLFENFVRNFLRREQDSFHVDAKKVAWDLDATTSSDPRWLPDMRTDITLTNNTSRIVLETKFYAASYQTHRSTTKKLISSHLYQLLTYLTHLRATPGPKPKGILLYAGTGEDHDLQYKLAGHDISIRTINLNQSWVAIPQRTS
jgi:5-methylcytosine-specific restriction enzyme subunit McrC